MTDPAPVRSWPVIVRRARPSDRDAVFEFASRTWNGWDYVPRAWPVWLADEEGVVLVATAGADRAGGPARDIDGAEIPADRPIAVSHLALLSSSEAWLEGIRVDPRVRGQGVATDLQVAELRWAAASGVDVLRYATGERNEASHRLGARHGFELLAALRLWRWYERPPEADGHDDDEASGYDEAVRGQATRARQALLADLEADGLVCLPDDGDEWWEWLTAERGFVARQRLFEHRGWALQELTRPIFDAYLEGREMLVLAGPGGGDRALALLHREQLPSEDADIHLALLAGEAGARARLADEIRRTADSTIRFWLPDTGSATPDEAAADLLAAGFHPRQWALHVLARPLAGHPPSQPDNPAALVLADEPVAITRED